jgi:hypothetical protein
LTIITPSLAKIASKALVNLASRSRITPPAGSLPGRPEQPHRFGLFRGFQAGDQVAEPLGAVDPGRVHERGQPEQLRAVSQPGGAQPAGVQPGQPAPPSSAAISGFVIFRGSRQLL